MADLAATDETAASALSAGDGWAGVQGGADVYILVSQVMAAVLALLGDTDGTLAANSDSKFATQKAVATKIAAAVTGLWEVKGGQDCSANPNYPAASKGDAYVVTVAGKIGGASGTTVDIGDTYVALLDNAGGTEASVGTSWFHLEHNLVGVALLASPTFTGTPAVPTAAPGTNTTQAASTAFVTAAVAAAGASTTPVLIQIACGDEASALTAGTAKVTFRAPYAFTLTGVRASVNTAPTGGTLLTVDINESGTTVLSTKLTFDASEKTTTTAATAAVISDSAIADDAEISIDIDAVGSTIAGAGLKVTLIGTKP